MKLATQQLGDTASTWLQGEVEAGRLAPVLDGSQLAIVAGILLSAAGGPRVSQKKERRGLDSAAIKEVRNVPATSAQP